MTIDLEAIRNTAVQAEFDTEVPTVPEGEYPAVVDKTDLRTATVQKEGPRKGEEMLFFDITWKIQDDGLREEIGRDPSVRQSLIIDVTPEGGLDSGTGKNVGLGRLRAALGQNDPTQPWSFDDVLGQGGIVKVKHRLYDGRVFADVSDVAPF